MEQSNSARSRATSVMETTEEGKLNSVEDLTLMDFLQNLTEKQWRGIREGMFDPLTKQQLAGLCLRIDQFLSDKLMQIIIPGLYELLGIQDAASSQLSQRSLTASLTSLLDDKANTKSRVRFTEAGVPKRPGSRKSYNSFRIPTPYPSSNCMEQKEEEEQESQQLKFKEFYLTKEMGSLGSGSYLPKGAMRSQTSLSEVQKKTTNSESLHVLLGLSEDTLVTCVQDSLQGSLSKLACMSDSPSGSAGSMMLIPAVMAELAKDVKSAVSLVVKSASASQTSLVTSGRRGDSENKVTESMVRELAAKLEKVDQESKSLTGQVMSTISDTKVAFVDENEQSLLEVLKDKITFLASHVGFIDDLDALIRKYESSYNISESGSSCTLTSRSIQKLSSRLFLTSAMQAVSGVLAKKVSSLSFPSSVVQSELTGAISGQTLSGIVKTESIHPVGSAASVVVKTFVSNMKSLAESEESPQQKSAWSAAAHIYHSIQNNLKDYFGKLQRCALKSIVTSDDNITNAQFKETVPLPCLDMKYRPSKSEPQLPESTGEVTLQRGLSESSKLIWAQTDSEESKLLLTTCTKEVISELLVLYNTEMSKEDPLYTVGEKGSDFSIERQQFVEGVLAQLGDISHSRASSSIVCEFPSQIEDSRSNATASLTSLLNCMKKLSSEEFKRNATQAVSEFLVEKSTSSLTSAKPAYSVATRSGSIQNRYTWSKDICADSAAFGIIDTFVEDLQSLAQPAEVEEREPDLQEKAQKLQSRIWSATTSLYNNIKKTLKDFTIHQRRSDMLSRMSSHIPTEDSEHLGTKEHICLASQDLRQASKSVPHLPSLNLEVALHRGVSESSKLLWTETDEALLTNSTKEVISTILTSCEDQTSNAPCFSTVGKKISDMSLEVNVLVGGVLSQLNNISWSRSPTPCEDMFERLQDSPERTSPVSLDCSTAASKGIASSHSLSTKSLQKLSSHEFQTKAEKGVSEVLSRSFNIVEEGTTDQSVSTSTTSTDIIQTMVKDQQELTQTTHSSDMVSGTSLLTTGQVSEKRIWSVARNIYHSLQSKIKEIIRKDLQRSDTTLDSIKMFTYQSSSASLRANLGHLEVNQSSVTSGGKDACVDIPHKLLPKTTELSGSMLEDNGMIRCRSAASQKTRKPSSSRSSISPTPTSKSRQSQWHFALPGTPIPTEFPAQIDFPIVRNTIIEDFIHTEDLLPLTFVDKVRQAAGVVVNIMVESVENTQENGQGASHLNDLRSAVRKLRKIISTWTIHIFSHELVDKVIAIQDSHSTPHVLTLEAAKSVSDSILSRLKWGKEQCAISKKLSSHLLQIFAEEIVKGFLKQWSDEYENINFDVSVQNDPKTSTCMVILQMITKATAKCYFESTTSVATSDIVDGVFDLARDTTSSTGEQVLTFNTKGSKKVSKNLCPQESLEYQPQNTSPTVYFTESMTNSHGFFAPEGNYDIASSFPLEEKSRKPSLFTRLCRAITKGFSSPFKSSRKSKLFH
ncbi:serine-rich adhesin for platelets-like [Salvelinus alpinus]|uniref:serine-rich adhesin for platelets-like n=1 Tax=Salvelinus alpinus TaxID=8036 RepID=UPI0039FCECA9